MALIGYHASQEQFKPSQLLHWTTLAEQAGFQAVNSSDHFHPWSERQGECGFSFAWLGASMQATSLPHGVVCSPGYRYHPAIVAQAAATLSEMFPGRFWISLGSGEALNECITGSDWPAKEERNLRLKECVDVIRRLLEGETVTHRGRVTVEGAKLYTRPQKMPLLIGAAVTEKTAAWVAEWADGLITINKPLEELQKVVKAFRENGGANKPMFLKVQLSFDQTESKALDGAYDQWRTNIFDASLLGNMSKVEQFDALGQRVQPEEMHGHVLISSDVNKHKTWLREFVGLGFERLLLHNVNREQERFIKEFGKQVLPSFR